MRKRLRKKRYEEKTFDGLTIEELFEKYLKIKKNKRRSRAIFRAKIREGKVEVGRIRLFKYSRHWQ